MTKSTGYATVGSDVLFRGRHLFGERDRYQNTILAKFGPGPRPEKLLHWEMREASWTNGWNISDSSGNGKTGYAQNVTTIMDPERGRVGNFRVPNTSSWARMRPEVLHNKYGFTISVWIKTFSINRSYSILSAAGSRQYNEILFWHSAQGRIAPHYHGPAYYSPPELEVQKWKMVTWVAAYGLHHLFFDGIKVLTFKPSLTATYIQNIFIGQEQDSNGGRFDHNQRSDAYLSDMCVFNGGLTDREVMELFNEQAHDPSMIKELPPLPCEDIVGFNNVTIDTQAKLEANTKSLYFSHINDRTYPRVDGFLNVFYSSSPIGAAVFEIPPGYRAIEVTFANFYQYSTARSYLYKNDTLIKTLVPNETWTGEIEYEDGDTLKFTENGMVYIGCIVMKT